MRKKINIGLIGYGVVGKKKNQKVYQIDLI